MPYYVIIFRLRFVLSSTGVSPGNPPQKKCFALTDIRINQQPTNQLKLSDIGSSFGIDQMDGKQTKEQQQNNNNNNNNEKPKKQSIRPKRLPY